MNYFNLEFESKIDFFVSKFSNKNQSINIDKFKGKICPHLKIKYKSNKQKVTSLRNFFEINSEFASKSYIIVTDL